MVKILERDYVDRSDLVGKFVEPKDFDILIDEDTDVYMKNTMGIQNETNIVLKFRKNIFSKEEQQGAFEGLVGAAGESQNRGIAAGPRDEKLQNRDWVSCEQEKIIDHFILQSELSNQFGGIEKLISDCSNCESKDSHCIHEKSKNVRGFVWLRSKIDNSGLDYDNWFLQWVDKVKKLSPSEQKEEGLRVKKEYISDTNYANPVYSGIAGYYDRYPRIPYGRATAYTENNYELFSKSFPYVHKLEEWYKTLLPGKYDNQLKLAETLDPRFRIDGSVFTTMTVNKNFRTAAHFDPKNLSGGIANLVSFSDENEWDEGYLAVPTFGVAVTLRPGDLIFVNNHTGLHGNTEIKPMPGKKEICRVTAVSYFREGMLDLGSWEYENLRKQFVEERRLDKNHELRKHDLWNGVSGGMWESVEWKNYLLKHGFDKEASKIVSNDNVLWEF